MFISPVLGFLWGATVVGSLIVLWFLKSKRRLAAWPSLLALCAFEATSSVLLFSIHHHYAAYFYIFWVSFCVKAAMRLWMLGDLVRSIPGASFIGVYARSLLLIAGTMMAVACALIVRDGGISWVATFRSSSRFARELLGTAILSDRCVSFACLAFAAVVIAAIILIGLGWEREAATIACGLGLQLLGGALCSIFLSAQNHRVRGLADYLGNLFHLTVLAIWILALNPSDCRTLQSSSSASITLES